LKDLDKKHAIFLVAEGDDSDALFDFIGLGFSSAKKPIERHVAPTVSISVNGKAIEVPATPVRSTNANGIVDYDLYETTVKLPSGSDKIPVVTATADNNNVKVNIEQAMVLNDAAYVKCDYNGVVKTYKLTFVVE
jgi:arabinoxylan arabinofuranohydrolase